MSSTIEIANIEDVALRPKGTPDASISSRSATESILDRIKSLVEDQESMLENDMKMVKEFQDNKDINHTEAGQRLKSVDIKKKGVPPRSPTEKKTDLIDTKAYQRLMSVDIKKGLPPRSPTKGGKPKPKHFTVDKETKNSAKTKETSKDSKSSRFNKSKLWPKKATPLVDNDETSAFGKESRDPAPAVETPLKFWRRRNTPLIDDDGEKEEEEELTFDDDTRDPPPDEETFNDSEFGSSRSKEPALNQETPKKSESTPLIQNSEETNSMTKVIPAGKKNCQKALDCPGNDNRSFRSILNSLRNRKNGPEEVQLTAAEKELSPANANEETIVTAKDKAVSSPTLKGLRNNKNGHEEATTAEEEPPPARKEVQITAAEKELSGSTPHGNNEETVALVEETREPVFNQETSKEAESIPLSKVGRDGSVGHRLLCGDQILQTFMSWSIYLPKEATAPFESNKETNSTDKETRDSAPNEERPKESLSTGCSLSRKHWPQQAPANANEETIVTAKNNPFSSFILKGLRNCKNGHEAATTAEEDPPPAMNEIYVSSEGQKIASLIKFFSPNATAPSTSSNASFSALSTNSSFPTNSTALDEVVATEATKNTPELTLEDISPQAFVREISQGIYTLVETQAEAVKKTLPDMVMGSAWNLHSEGVERASTVKPSMSLTTKSTSSMSRSNMWAGPIKAKKKKKPEAFITIEMRRE